MVVVEVLGAVVVMVVVVVMLVADVMLAGVAMIIVIVMVGVIVVIGVDQEQSAIKEMIEPDHEQDSLLLATGIVLME